LGLKILWGLRPGDGRWVNGYAYDPDSGKTYRATAEQTDDNHLKFRGYVGIPLLGKSVTMSRYHEE
jgi:uncharacterized protein (DUF2147 family)